MRSPGAFRAIALTVALVSFALSGCIGRDFKPPPLDDLTLGTTSPRDVIGRLGEAYQERTRLIAAGETLIYRNPLDPVVMDGTYTTFVYTFADAAGAPVFGGTSPARTLALEFRDNRLFYYCYASSFQEDATNFDEAKIAAIRKGETTKAEVQTLIGKPSGRAMYPEIRIEDGERYIYTYSAVRPLDRQATRKRLDILFDVAGKVVDLRFFGDTIPIQDFTSAALIPLVMPAAR